MSEITNNPSVPSQVVAEVKFPRFINNLGIIPTSYKDSMDYYETLAWLCKYLEETVIPTVNANGQATEELQALYVELNSYVSNYFTNLDVQEEINNKLDDMVEAGTLQEIIASYLNATAVWGFDTVSSMKSSTNLITGSYARTLGYYSKNDGGEAIYKIRTRTLDDTVDEMFLILMNDNTLVAELVYNNFINIKSIGAKGDNTQDDTEIIQAAINKLTNGIVYIPTGNYKITRTNSFVTTDYGNYTSKYSLLIENKENIIINGEGTLCPDLSIENFNCITIKDSNNIEVKNIKAKYEDTANSDTSILHTKFLVYAYNSSNIKCFNLESTNVGGCACTTLSTNCTIKNSKASRTNTNYTSPALFGSYKSTNIIFDNCTCYGSCEDGDISIFGSCKNCKVINSKIFNSLESTPDTILLNTHQGYCVDSGCINTSLINNYAYGYFYGIDVKTSCENTLVSENQLERNKISITSRLGEDNATNFDTQILNNVINVNNGNGNTTTKIDDFYNIGIYLEHNEGATVSGNLIGNDTVANGYTNPFIGIGCIYNKEVNRASEKNNIITNNTINMETRKGSQYAYSNAPAIYLKGSEATKLIKNYIISNNTIKPHYAQSLTYFDIVVNYAYNIILSNNLFTNKPNSNGYIKIDNSDLISINGNKFNSSNKAFSVTNTTNLIVNNNSIISSGNSNYSYLIDTCTNFKVSDNYYQKTGSTESDVGVIRSSTNGIVQNNVAVTTKSHFYATPGNLPNTNVSEDNTTIFTP